MVKRDFFPKVVLGQLAIYAEQTNLDLPPSTVYNMKSKMGCKMSRLKGKTVLFFICNAEYLLHDFWNRKHFSNRHNKALAITEKLINLIMKFKLRY